jgi:hypothetical protein
MPSLGRNDTLRMWAGRYARLVFERCNRNNREACRALGISYHTLRAYLRLPTNVDDPEDRARRIPLDTGGGSAIGDDAEMHVEV